MKQLLQAILKPFGYRLVNLARQERRMLTLRSTLKGLTLRDFSPRQIIDVGASNGSWTDKVMESFPDASYFLVEAMEERRPALEKFKALHPNTDFCIAALGEKSGEVSMNITADGFGTAVSETPDNARTVPLITLDQLLDDGSIQPPDFIKMDIQGYEWYALQGATRCLEKCRIVILECIMHPGKEDRKLMADLIILMKEHGFIPYEIVDAIERQEHSYAMSQCDIMFVKLGDPLIDNKYFRWNHTPENYDT